MTGCGPAKPLWEALNNASILRVTVKTVLRGKAESEGLGFSSCTVPLTQSDLSSTSSDRTLERRSSKGGLMDYWMSTGTSGGDWSTLQGRVRGLLQSEITVETERRRLLRQSPEAEWKCWRTEERQWRHGKSDEQRRRSAIIKDKSFDHFLCFEQVIGNGVLETDFAVKAVWFSPYLA
ncbi:uncharacterized protein EDB91DRAFT_1081582 [Suillus paluster]|uniref:uncharacterized protein n=1 Tax=Suillus paluster TaxID=48578 RepID=UPI001B875F09|nr:uncharacterized protein EDB91DRAFT_1081582 [Suillus paluster]KAG1741773.1 hypothetical protein EDB91DRAFT_1081582 [Suillus paluster]